MPFLSAGSYYTFTFIVISVSMDKPLFIQHLQQGLQCFMNMFVIASNWHTVICGQIRVRLKSTQSVTLPMIAVSFGRLVKKIVNILL